MRALAVVAATPAHAATAQHDDQQNNDDEQKHPNVSSPGMPRTRRPQPYVEDFSNLAR
jgi:hypothetical protein